MKNYTGVRGYQTGTNKFDHGGRVYYLENQWYYHRLDGPAIISPDGEEEFWIDDKRYEFADYEKHPNVIKFQNLQKLKTALGV